jgi:hypothetical protein
MKLFQRFLQSSTNLVPVDDLPESFNEFASVILVVYVVGVFENVQKPSESEHWINVHVMFFPPASALGGLSACKG